MINPLTPGRGFFAKMRFLEFFCKKCVVLDILVVLRLDLGQISFNPVEMRLQHSSLPLLPLKHRVLYTCQLFVRYKRETFLPGVRGISEEDTIISEDSRRSLKSSEEV